MARKSIYIILAAILVTGCEINQKEILPEDSFLKIYNHPDEILSFYPESVLQLSGGDYLFVSAVKDETSDIEYPYTYLVRTGADGVVQWTQTYDWLAPASKLFFQNGQVGFIAMNQQFAAHAVLVDPSNGDVVDQHDLEMTMPLSAYTDDNGNLVVLGYDFVSRSSWISKYNSSFTLQRSNKLPINTDLEHLVQRHLNKTGEHYPFYIGEYSNTSGTGYYVSCFYNYTLRTVFLDVSSLNATGDIYSFQTDEAISSTLFKSGSLFGLTGYYEGNNYIIPDTEINVTTSQNIKDIPGDPLYELTQKARVQTSEITTGQGDFALFISQTNTNAIVVYQYDMHSDSLVNTHYQTFDERVEVADVIRTGDNGIAILAGVFILGKYLRPVLVKMPEKPFLPEEE
ncbi:MAG: hypothetical protein KAT15_22305 [Bacteroidales bacterium]|nr:hypothetical protein [Bacteroidales bacterium]